MKLSRCSRGHFYNGGKHASCPYCSDGSDSQQDFHSPDSDGYQDGEERTLPVSSYVYDEPEQEPGYSEEEEEHTIPLDVYYKDQVKQEPGYSEEEEDYTIPLDVYNKDQVKQEPGYSEEEEEHTIPLDIYSGNQPPQNKIAQESPEDKMKKASKPELVSDPGKNCRSYMPAAGWLVCIEGRNLGRDYRIIAGKNTIGRGENNSIALTEDTSVSWEAQISVVYEAESNMFYALPEISRNLGYVNGQIIIERTELQKNDVLELGTCKLMLIPCCDDKFDWNRVCGNESKISE